MLAYNQILSYLNRMELVFLSLYVNSMVVMVMTGTRVYTDARPILEVDLYCSPKVDWNWFGFPRLNIKIMWLISNILCYVLTRESFFFAILWCEGDGIKQVNLTAPHFFWNTDDSNYYYLLTVIENWETECWRKFFHQT